MTTEDQLRGKIQAVIMNNQNIIFLYEKLMDDFVAMVNEVVAESVVPLQKRINALESLVDELEEDLEAIEDRYRSIT